ncbi:LysR family transcriptional regulator [Kaistia sp. 32K]|uniref:LysR family transcriptional regulator n=1 Tax=Kaistia sp. 32K TaxID=2795690 RepID=UPI0019151E75|nr:LysR family transcriptional regulator [Kaistia sp. 32K]BCP52605.1 LysR family transcriptional regulator [Kaistia sp. 32K]
MIDLARLEGIATFVEVADAGSFTRAGERLGLGRSAVGKTIARLEARLGVRLFNRTTRSLSLTDEGSRFRESCLKALAELESAEASLAERTSAAAGTLRIEIPVLFGRQWVLPVLLEIARAHPRLRLDVAFANRRADLTTEGIDLAVRIGALDDVAGLAARRLGTQTTQLCASPAYLDRAGRPGTLAELAGHDCLVERRQARPTPWRLVDSAGRSHVAAVGGPLALDRADAIADAVIAGHGIACLPRWLVAPMLRAGVLETVLPEMTSDALPIHAVWPLQRPMPLRLRVVLDALFDRFLPTPPWDDTA